jgi:hypothetical protein
LKAKRKETRLRYDLIPKEFIDNIALIFEEGQKKYGEDNWKSGDRQFFRDCLNHAQDHLLRFNNGDRSENHLAKVAWNCLAYLWWMEKS